jgi:transcriptional regulator with XRE-family HTH domain
MARKKHPPISAEDKRSVGATLRDLRRAAGYRSVEAASSVKGCPASRQTIYAYERGGLVPSLAQFLEIVEFYTLEAPPTPTARPDEDLKALGVAAVTRALTLQAYHVPRAWDLIARLQSDHAATTARRKRT